MKRETTFLAITLCLIVAGLGFYLYRQQVCFQILHENYASLLQDHRALEERHASLESRYNSLNSQYSTLRSEHGNLVSKHDALSQNYDSLQSENSALQTEYQRLSEQHDALVRDYKTIYNSRYEEGYDAGYVEGVIQGAGSGYDIRDPTYQEALQFTSSDKTDENQYAEGEYTCVNFAADFKNNALEAEYRCGFVYIQFLDSAHAIVCFNTTDQGLIFIEPQDDELVTLTIGQSFYDRTKYKVTFDDTVIRFVIVW